MLICPSGLGQFGQGVNKKLHDFVLNGLKDPMKQMKAHEI
jgi:hypothetical protein